MNIEVSYTLQEFAKMLVDSSGFNAPAIAKMLGLSKGTFYNWLNGTTTRVDIDFFTNKLKYLDDTFHIAISRVTNSAILLLEERYVQEDKHPEEEANIIESRGHWFKVINSIDAGDPQAIYRVENYTGEEAYFPFGTEKSCFALKVEGDSMTNPYGDSIPNGEYVLADLSETALPGDIIVVSLTGGRQMIKQYVDGPEDNITLRSFNPNYPDIVVKKIDVIKMVRVIGQGHFKRR